jgi:hypothetical protein
MRSVHKSLVAAAMAALLAGACSSGGSSSSSTSTTARSGGASTPSQQSSQPAPSKVIATVPTTQPGLVMELNDLRRGQGDVVTARFTIVNQGSETGHVQFLFFPVDNDWKKSYLLDGVNHKKYLTLLDADKNCLCSKVSGEIKPGERQSYFASFPAPPDSVSSVQVVIDGCSPVDNVTIAKS